MSGKTGDLPPHVLHVLPDAEAVRIIGAFGNRLRHTLVTGDGDWPQGLRQTAYCKPASHFPALQGMASPGRLQKLARAMTPFDLVLTYGYDALDVAMAHTLFKDAMDLPALVHHEAQADPKASAKRTWYRRIALGKSAGLVVPSEALEEAALVTWQQPMGRVKRIAPGIDTKAFAKPPKKDGFRIIKRAGEAWVGAWPQGAQTGLTDLVNAFAQLPAHWQLVILGEDARTQALDLLCEELGLEDRVFFPGVPRDPARVMGLFDIFVQTVAEPGFPVPAAQAMAASVPIIAPRNSETGALVAPANEEWLTESQTSPSLSAHLRALASEAALRRTLGEANRQQAVRTLDRDRALETHRQLYASAMKREF